MSSWRWEMKRCVACAGQGVSSRGTQPGGGIAVWTGSLVDTCST